MKNTSNDEIAGWIALGCLAIGAIAVASKKKKAYTTPAVTVEYIEPRPKVFMGPNGGLYRIVGNRKVYDVA